MPFAVTSGDARSSFQCSSGEPMIKYRLSAPLLVFGTQKEHKGQITDTFGLLISQEIRFIFHEFQRSAQSNQPGYVAEIRADKKVE